MPSRWTIEDFKDYIFDYDEYDQWVFVALLQGDLAENGKFSLNGWSAQAVYSRTWLKNHPKIAQLAKSAARRLPQGR